MRRGHNEIVSMVGVNGAGKSTLVNTIAGMLRPVAGRILMDGKDITRIASHNVCEHGVAVVLEGRRILPQMTVQDNLNLGSYRPGIRAEHDDRLAWIHSLFPILKDGAIKRRAP